MDKASTLRISSQQIQSQVNVFENANNQIEALSAIIDTFERTVFGKLRSGETLAPLKISTHEQLCEKWRKKVFEVIVQKKNIELIAH
mmetsp:Transcript_5187/g.8008  ORF Transcript_5187/g.8008 Transcript_5187/m.8008 type:complete len:87 (+) Transcript_5187:664-924(+)